MPNYPELPAAVPQKLYEAGQRLDHAAKCCLYCRHCGYEWHPENDDGEEDQPVCKLAGRLPVNRTDVCDKYDERTRP